MKISLNWLREYIPFDFSAEELAERLTMAGLEVEEIHWIGPSFSGIVVGEVLRVEKHPAAERLKVCTVDTGTEVLSVICGAPNVAEGQRLPVAKVGAILGDGSSIESVSIRGVKSDGMICSERELGLSDDHSGILVLDKKTHSIGDDFSKEFSKRDTVLEINVTPNRPDCLSFLGIAREIGVMVDQKVVNPDVTVEETNKLANDGISVEVVDSQACPRYSARIVYDVKIAPSPQWLKTKLESVGIRSINNVVDVTNYVLMETGHPLHGFDYDLIQRKKIIVRKAERGEVFTTLDGTARTLTPDDLLICDEDRGVALAGIMGGLNSEISEYTQNVLLESAYFDPMTIRKTAKRLGLSTEASQRFERGADPNNTLYAVDRAARLLAKIAGGKVARGVVDVYPNELKPWKVLLRPSRIPVVLGSDIPRKTVLYILQKLDLLVEDTDPIQVTVPTFRPDLTREIDLIEEIVRHYGYEKIEPRLYSNVALTYSSNKEPDFAETVRDIFVGLGFMETISNSLVSKDHVSYITPEVLPVVVKNPLSPETAFLRTSLIPNLLDSIRWNKNHSTNNLRLFEIGRAFRANRKSLPDEKIFVTGALSGYLRSKSFWREKDREVDFFHLKGVIENLMERLHISGFYFVPANHAALENASATAISYNSAEIGLFGEIKKAILERWDIDERVFVFEIDLKELFSSLLVGKKYTPIPKFPSVRRDLAVVVDEKVPVNSIKKVIREVGGKKLISVDLFDLYRGKQIPSGKKSVAFSLTFLSQARTLKEEEVDPVVSSIVNALGRSFSASLRS